MQTCQDISNWAVCIKVIQISSMRVVLSYFMKCSIFPNTDYNNLVVNKNRQICISRCATDFLLHILINAFFDFYPMLRIFTYNVYFPLYQQGSPGKPVSICLSLYLFAI